MADLHPEGLLRKFSVAVDRRLGGKVILASLVATLGLLDGTDAKKGKKKKKCKPACTGGSVCQKRQCVCPAGTKSCNGQCIASNACCNDSDCGAGRACRNGSCGCPAGQELCDGVCTASNRVCGERCCPVEVACFPEGCICDEFICSCAADRTFCSTPDDTQCCAPGDTCDPVAACTTNTCSAENDVCTAGGAFCGEGFCLCTTKVGGNSFCADFDALSDCPAESACEADGDCAAGESCANVPCCVAGGTQFFGVCLPACATAQRSRHAATDHARQRRQLAQVLHLNPTRSRSRGR